MMLAGYLPGYRPKPPPRYRSGHLRLIVCGPSNVVRLFPVRPRLRVVK